MGFQRVGHDWATELNWTDVEMEFESQLSHLLVMASGPITLWQIDGETVETVADFILGGSKITADGDCSYEIKTLTS